MLRKILASALFLIVAFVGVSVSEKVVTFRNDAPTQCWLVRADNGAEKSVCAEKNAFSEAEAVAHGIAINAGGWTVLPFLVPTSGTCTGPSGTANGTCVTYVSATGTATTLTACTAAMPASGPDNSRPDSGACNPISGFYTNRAIYDQLRDHQGDWAALKCGTTINRMLVSQNGTGTFGGWRSNGASATALQVLTTYACDSTKPYAVIDPQDQGCIAVSFTGGSYMALVGLHCYFGVNDPSSASYTAPLTTTATSCLWSSYTGSISGTTLTVTGLNSIATVTWASSVATATTTAPHGYATSQTFPVTITGMSPSGYNGNYKATATGASTFTYALASNPGAQTVAGTYQGSTLVAGAYVLFPGVTAGTKIVSGPGGNGSYVVSASQTAGSQNMVTACDNPADVISVSSIPGTLITGLTPCDLNSVDCTANGSANINSGALVSALNSPGANQISLQVSGNPNGVNVGKIVSAGNKIAFSNANSGIGWNPSVAFTYLLIEGNMNSFTGASAFQWAGTEAAIPVPNPNLNIIIRRNVFHHNYNMLAHAQGFFIGDIGSRPCQNLTGTIRVEENLFDHNGWNNGPNNDWIGQVAGAGGVVFNHNVYLHDCNPPVTFVSNVSARASSHGVQVRPGGTVYGNTFIEDSIGYLIYTGFQTSTTTASYNWITSSSDIQLGAYTTSAGCTSPCTKLTMTTPIYSGNSGANVSLYNITQGVNIAQLTSSVTNGNELNLSAAPTPAVNSGDRIMLYLARGAGVDMQMCGGQSTVIAGSNGDTVLKLYNPMTRTVSSGDAVMESSSGASPGPHIQSGTVVVGSPNVISSTEIDVTISKSLVGATTAGLGGTAMLIYSTPVSSPADVFCTVTNGPNNIYSNQKGKQGGSVMTFYPGSFYFNNTENWFTPAGADQYLGGIADYGTNNSHTNNHGAYGLGTGSTYTPVGLATPEAYDSAVMSGPGTVNHLMAVCTASQNRYSWDNRCTGKAMYNFGASQTSATITPINWLLKRDIDPASNDNDPMWLEKAA